MWRCCSMARTPLSSPTMSMKMPLPGEAIRHPSRHVKRQTLLLSVVERLDRAVRVGGGHHRNARGGRCDPWSRGNVVQHQLTVHDEGDRSLDLVHQGLSVSVESLVLGQDGRCEDEPSTG